MNNNKNNSGWILCPSKRFPGKFYYYNVLNGESAWSFNETEKKLLRIDDKTQRVSQKYHRYPEPASPPYKSPNHFSKSHLALTQTFGRAVFPKYISPCALKWAPTQMPISSCALKWAPTQMPIKFTKPSIQQRDIDTQTSLPEGDIIVESSKEPLSQRFYKYQHSGNENKKASLTNVNLSAIDNLCKEDTTDNPEHSFHLSKPISNTVKETVVLSTKRKYIENSSLCNDLKIGNERNMEKIDEAKELNLPKHDLRYVLQAKISKAACKKTDDGLPPKITKKKVTFAIHDSEEEDEDNDNYGKEKDKIIITKAIYKEQNNYNEPIYWNDKKDDDFKNFKMVVNNETHNNLFLQRAEEFNSFFSSKKEQPISMTNTRNTLQYSNNDKCTNINKKEHFFKFRNNNDQILSDEVEEIEGILDITRNIAEKLQIKKPREILAISGNSRIQTIESRHQENPFRIQKSKTTYERVPNLKNKNKSGIVVSVLNSNTNNQSFKNSFECKDSKFLENRKITSDRDTSCFSLKNGNQFSSFASVFNNSTNLSKYTQDNIPNVIQNSNISSKITNDFKKYGEIDGNKTIECSMNDKLRKFYIKNKVIEERVILRMDELICCLTQIVEDFIHNILETSSCPPQYSLYEVLLNLQKMYNHRPTVLQVVDKMIELRLFCPKTGYIQNNIQPHILFKAIGCCIILIEEFKELQDSDIQNAQNALLQLLQDMEEPKYVEMPELPVSVIKDDTDSDRRQNFIKSRLDMLEYLQKHFPQWKTYNPLFDEQDRVTEKIAHNNVLRIKGKDLQFLKINNKNQMYTEKEGEKEINEQKENDKYAKAKVIRNFKTINEFEQRLYDSNSGESSIMIDDGENKELCDLQSNSKNLFKDNNNYYNMNENISKEFNEVRNKDLQYFNHMSKEKSEFISNNQEICGEFYDLCNNDSRYFKNSEINNKNGKNNELHKLNDYNNSKIIDDENEHVLNDIQNNDSHLNDSKEKNNDSNSSNNDEVIDISEENANEYYRLVKKFLMELSDTLQLIYSFIEESLRRFRNRDVTEDNKKMLYEETNNTYIYLKDIIEKLKSIIERETLDDNSLRTLLASANGALDDKHVTRYRQIVTKCLEQARIMESSLKILLNMTDDNCTLSVSSDLCDTTYINIFE